MSIKEFCFAAKCTYRKQVDKNKAFCMLPKCPYRMTKYITPKGRALPENATVTDIIQRNKELGLIP